MPIFEYKCKNCGYKFEELIYKEKEICCPKCKSTKVEKQVSGFSFKCPM